LKTINNGQQNMEGFCTGNNSCPPTEVGVPRAYGDYQYYLSFGGDQVLICATDNSKMLVAIIHLHVQILSSGFIFPSSFWEKQGFKPTSKDYDSDCESSTFTTGSGALGTLTSLPYV